MLMPVNGNLLDFHSGEKRLFRLCISNDTMLHNRLYGFPTTTPTSAWACSTPTGPRSF
ncbi:hypothetical protein [Streptomyces sp. NPDC005969]|uniref:hypothetical protein n=1 Tax=Streptomyces sp. NPDC005969 TaxID=3156722 RepID=UPI003411DF52